MSLERSPSQIQWTGTQPISWNLRPSGFAAVDLNSLSAKDLFFRLIQVIDEAVFGLPAMEARINALKAKGVNVAFLQPKYEAWAYQAQKGLDFFANLISSSSDVQSVIDNKAGVQTTPGLHEIRVGAWKEIVADLVKPTAQTGLGFVATIVTGVGRALTNPAVWMGIKDILIFALPWVAGVFITDNIKQTIVGADDAKDKLEKCVSALEAAGNDVEKRAQVERLCGATLSTSSEMLWLLLGGAAGVGALLYFQGKKPGFSVQSRSAALSGLPRKRRRRR